MKHAVVLGLICLLFSCASTAKAPSGADLKAMEEQTATTGPITFVPEVEAANLRIALISFEMKAEERKTTTYQFLVGSVPQIRPLGVDLGNALAIDSAGNVFLDVLKLLKIDVANPFRVECALGGVFAGRSILQRDASGLSLRARVGRGPVEMSDTDFILKNAAGKNQIAITLTEGTYAYKSLNALDPNYELRVAGDQLVISGGLQHTVRVLQEGESVVFNAASDPDWPVYTVTKQGDSYSIECKGGDTLLKFKLYYTADGVYLVRNGIVVLNATIDAGSIVVNGKKLVTYSKG